MPLRLVEESLQRLPQLITPYAEARVQNSSYELSLGTQIFVTGDDSAKRQIQSGTQIVIPPGQFANLLTTETVRVPDDAIGLISMKFTLKQPGLVNVSGFHVDPGYVGKLLFVRAGESLSLQYHERKDESWLVQDGRARLELGALGGDLEEIEIAPGDAFRFRPGTVHRVTAVEDTLVIEVSTPHLDDVVRLDDRYGREGTSAP